MMQLSGFDASFLYSETEATPMHTLKVIVLARDPRDRRPTEAWIRAGLERAVARLPALRSVPRAGRSVLSHPRWEEVAVDLDQHVRFARTWARGPASVEALIARHLEGTLPRDRPLWSVLVLEQAGSTGVTLAFKYHHALADGLGSGRMLELLASGARPEPVPSPDRVGVWRRLRAALALAAAAVLGLARSLSHRQIAPFSGGREAYNAPVGARRRVAFASLPLASVRAAGRALEGRTTVNDVLVALVASALGRVSRAAGQRPSRPLVAAQPVAIGDTHDRGNQLSTMLVPVHVEVADPRACLAETRRSNACAKSAHEARGSELVMRLSELTPGPLLRLIWGAIRRLPRPPANLVISNIPGSRGPLSLFGARVRSVHLAGPLLPTTGLNVTFWSHDGAVHVTVLASDGIEPAAVAEEIERALERLLRAGDEEGAQRDSQAA